MDGYIKLTGAILEQTIKDYKAALLAANGLRAARKSEESAKALERFFLSKWGQALSFNHGELIIERVRKEVLQNG